MWCWKGGDHGVTYVTANCSLGGDKPALASCLLDERRNYSDDQRLHACQHHHVTVSQSLWPPTVGCSWGYIFSLYALLFAQAFKATVIAALADHITMHVSKGWMSAEALCARSQMLMPAHSRCASKHTLHGTVHCRGHLHVTVSQRAPEAVPFHHMHLHKR
jgi:hypothetical protein